VGGITVDQVKDALLFLIALILSVSVHEFGHAWMATKLGDDLPRRQGRLTLSPLAHIDPIGTIVFPLIIAFTGAPLLGWGRPVETQPRNYTRRFTMRGGHALVSVAGPAMNLVLAIIVSVLLVVLSKVGILRWELAILILTKLVVLNLYLMFFNLLPLPPLDGGTVLGWAMPPSGQPLMDFLERWGGLILLGLVLMPGALGTLMAPARFLIDGWLRAVVALMGS
jgi:Zn-dependent protease